MDQNSERALKKEGVYVQHEILDRRTSHQTGLRDTTGLGKTSLFFNKDMMAS